MVLFPNSRWFKPHALLRLSSPLISGTIEDRAVSEVHDVLGELHNGLSDVCLYLSPTQALPRLEVRMANDNPEEDWLGGNPIQIRIWFRGPVIVESIIGGSSTLP
jgi:hypothetical protein